MAFFWLLRLNRSLMVAMVAGAAAFTAGPSLWMTLAGWSLAVGGYSVGDDNQVKARRLGFGAALI
jgi:hypothetical protein